jgi:hypothetical protein
MNVPRLLRAVILAIAVSVGSIEAQDGSATPPADYSPPTLIRLLAEPPSEERGVRYENGVVHFPALGTSWQFHYLPGLFLPLSGSGGGISRELPDPFALTQTAIAMSPRAWARGPQQRNGELMRIDLAGKRSVRVTAGTK